MQERPTLRGVLVAAVGSRSADNARAFAGKWGIEHAHGSYDELVADPDADIVYVVTPHNFHAANATAALENGKHVLVEKAFTVNAAEARAVFQLGRSKGLLVMEAMWTRFLPHGPNSSTQNITDDSPSSGRTSPSVIAYRCSTRAFLAA
ncbi:Gfo/Idh/MocA family oxidoreductase [Nonomuraea mesophila]|uniref:Gfo/Idh/MocA family protein n=1 Tax=Nonomuraea mesophila TaxID=2530382 RepID=UPI00319E5662